MLFHKTPPVMTPQQDRTNNYLIFTKEVSDKKPDIVPGFTVWFDDDKNISYIQVGPGMDLATVRHACSMIGIFGLDKK